LKRREILGIGRRLKYTENNLCDRALGNVTDLHYRFEVHIREYERERIV